MSMTRKFTEGDTGRLSGVTLYDGDGSTRTAVAGTGLTLSLELRDRGRALVPIAGKVDWLVAASGTVYYDPAATDLRAANSPYSAKWKVTDGSGKVKSYPSGDGEVWIVTP